MYVGLISETNGFLAANYFTLHGGFQKFGLEELGIALLTSLATSVFRKGLHIACSLPMYDGALMTCTCFNRMGIAS